MLTLWQLVVLGLIVSTAGGEGAIKTSWMDAGYTRVLYFKTGADFVRQHAERFEVYGWDELDALLTSLPVVENFNDAYVLYRLAVE